MWTGGRKGRGNKQRDEEKLNKNKFQLHLYVAYRGTRKTLHDGKTDDAHMRTCKVYTLQVCRTHGPIRQLLLHVPTIPSRCCLAPPARYHFRRAGRDSGGLDFRAGTHFWILCWILCWILFHSNRPAANWSALSRLLTGSPVQPSFVLSLSYLLPHPSRLFFLL